MTYKKLTLEQIFDWRGQGKEICGYIRNVTYKELNIRGTCALSRGPCHQVYVPQEPTECWRYNKIWKRKQEELKNQ